MRDSKEGAMGAPADDIEALRAELKNLRADFAKVTGLLKDTARNRGAEAADKIRETAERGWNEAKSTAESVIEEMEARPLGTAVAVFVAGVVLGLLVAGRR
jgi:F0F1-type ATP synthase membrane subunit b/b'